MKNRLRRCFALVTGLILCLCVLAGCGSSASTGDASDETESAVEAASSEETETSEEETTEEESGDELDFDSWTTITTSGITDEDVVFSVLPSGYNNYETEHEGTVVKIYYTTDVYGDTVEKYATVYLPYGYDENDTETKYNIIYFQHGGMGSPNELWDHDMTSLHAKNLINNIFDPDHQVMEPCIIVCPTFYLEYDDTAYTTPSDALSADGGRTDGGAGTEGLYCQEIIQDLIPAVESQFNVYCEDFSEEGIIAARDHRAFGGYSLGSVLTYDMFHYAFEYFAYWMPTSGGAMYEGSNEIMTGEDLYEYLKSAIDANPELDFYIFASTGSSQDLGTEQMITEYPYLIEQTDTFSFGTDPEENNLYYCQSEFLHNDLYFPYSLAAAADILFK